MQPAKLHIVSYDVPYPPDYGGAIDLFYKIKSLSEAGCEIYLHCYEYGRGHTSELEKYCKAVWFYPRKTGWKGISLSLPYIVYSRRDKALLQRLQEIDAPILFEGIHTTLYLSHPSLKTRYKAVRTHNIEYQYYLQLSQKKNSFFAKTYLKIETALIRKYERKLYDANAFFELSLSDRDYFKEQYPTAQHTFLAPFHPYDEVSSLPGTGTYCLYHGNLSHPENREAVLFLLNEVFAGTDIPIVIALFCNLQANTAHQLGVSDTLMVAANSTGGVTGKMISPQSIAVATAATGLVGHESDLFRFTLKHSLLLAGLVGVITTVQAYLLVWMIP